MPYSDLNRGRYSCRNNVYSITTVTRGRDLLFPDFRAARLLVGEMQQLHKSNEIDSLAWVVMPDHLHWLFQLGDSLSLSEVIKRLKGRSTHAINRHLNRSGGIWQRAYYDRAARSDDDIRILARYIVANPLRARLVQRIGDYPHWDCAWL